jgi:hypothetical protein
VPDRQDIGGSTALGQGPLGRVGALARPLLELVLLAAVAAGAAFLLVPGAAQRMPRDVALGARADRTIRAARDYDVPDEEATRQRREEAAAAERRVYDHDDGAIEEAAARIRGAFQLMRGAEEQPAARPTRRGDPGVARRALAGQRDAFVALLQTLVRDEDLDALAQARFSEEAQEWLVGLARVGLAGPVVQDQQLLAAERGRGLVVREVHEGQVRSERVVTEIEGIRDLARARADVERAGSELPRDAPQRLRAALVRIAASMTAPTLALDQAETRRRQRDAAGRVKPVVMQLKRGEKIIGDGEPIEAHHLLAFRAIRAQDGRLDRWSMRAGAGALVGLLVVLLWRHARRSIPGFRPAAKDEAVLAGLLLAALGLAALGVRAADLLHEMVPAVPPESLAFLVPFAVPAMLVGAIFPAGLALLFAVAAGAAAGLVVGQPALFGIFATLTSVAAAALAPGVRRRRELFRAGLAVGLLGAALVVASGLFAGRLADAAAAAPRLAEVALLAFAGGTLLLPLAMLALLPVAASLLGYVTQLRLVELASLNHPALKELIVQAPGTYHHSIVMGSLVEEAARAVGADPLLSRVCAYYHDVGKIRNPLFFAENQRAENRHETLPPSRSALLVKQHVADGVVLGRQWKLPRPVVDAIAQHHGTRLVSFFWAKARMAAESQEGRPPEGPRPPEPAEESESHFRYPGPKPQSREAALVMIADACEGSSRAVTDPSPERIAMLVQRRIGEILDEGQLDECDLTVRDLNAVAEAMTRALAAFYRARPEPGTRAPEDRDRPPPVHLVVRP